MLTRIANVFRGKKNVVPMVKGSNIDPVDEPLAQSPLQLSGIEVQRKFFVDVEALKVSSENVARESLKVGVTQGEEILKKVADLFKPVYKDYSEMYLDECQKRIKDMALEIDRFNLVELMEKYKEVVTANFEAVKNHIYTRYQARFVEESQGENVKKEKLDAVESLRQYTIAMTGDERTQVIIQHPSEKRNRIVAMFLGLGVIEAIAGFEQFKRASNTASALATSVLVIGVLTALSVLFGDAIAHRRGFRKAKKAFSENYPNGVDPKNPRGERLKLLSWPDNIEVKPMLCGAVYIATILIIFGVRGYQVSQDKNSTPMVIFGLLVLLIANIVGSLFEADRASAHQKDHEFEYQLRLAEVIRQEGRDLKEQRVLEDDVKKRDYQGEYEEDVKKTILSFPDYISKEREKVQFVLSDLNNRKEDLLDLIDECDKKWVEIKNAYFICAAYALSSYRKDKDAPMGHSVKATYSDTENVLSGALGYDKTALTTPQVEKIKKFELPVHVVFPKFEFNLFEEKKKIETEVNANRMPAVIQ